MIDHNKVANKIFNVLKGHGLNVTMFTDDGMQSTDPEEARRFFVQEPNIMVTLDDQEDEIKMSKNKNLSLEEVRSIILQIRMLAEEYMLEFTLRVFGHEIVPRDYAYDAEKKGETMEGINEGSLSKMFGSKKTSYQTLEDVKMIVRHRTPVNEEQRGSRSRNISAIFLECNGERFKFPHKSLAGARAMSRHLSMGGAFDDMMAEHIITTTGNIIKLAEFVNYTKKNKLVNESSEDVLSVIKENMKHLRNDLKRISGVKTYESIRMRVEETQAQELAEQDLADLKDMFTVKKFDEQMNDVLPIVGRIVAEKDNFYRRIEESSMSVTLVPRTAATPADILEFDSTTAKLAHKLSEMSQRFYENDELRDFVGGITRKLVSEGELSVFEKAIIRNILEGATIQQLEEEKPSEITESVQFERFFDQYENIFL